MDTIGRDATVADDLSLRLWEEQNHKGEIGPREDNEEPKDPAPAELLGQNTSDDGSKAGCCTTAGCISEHVQSKKK